MASYINKGIGFFMDSQFTEEFSNLIYVAAEWEWYFGFKTITYGDFDGGRMDGDMDSWTSADRTYYVSYGGSEEIEKVYVGFVGGSYTAEEASIALSGEKTEIDYIDDGENTPYFTFTTPEDLPNDYRLNFFIKFKGAKDFPMPVSGFQGSIVTENCTADKPEINSVDNGGSFSVTFTPATGYSLTTDPLITGTVTSEILRNDDGTVTVNLTDVQSDFLIYATAVSEEPQPTVDGYAFVNAYNPTVSQLKEIANKLIGNIVKKDGQETVETIDLSRYIVNLCKVFIPLATSVNLDNVKFGNYNTFIASKVISERYYTFSCGEVNVLERHHNALDYSPYTTAKIWLPFLGFFDLDVDLVINNTIEVVYRIDCFTGKCVAEILNENKSVIYRFVGTCFETEPYYFNQGEDMTESIVNQAYNMSNKYPYFVITRPIDLTPKNTNLLGNPTYEIVTIGDMKGYLRCVKVYAKDMIATEAEKREIESLLMSGVLVD